TGTRVAIDGTADNIGDFHRDLGRKLRNAAKSGRTIEVYVNPDNPAEAVANRDARWGLIGFKSIFLIVFGGVATAILYAVITHKPKDPSIVPSDQPWLANDRWQADTIKSDSKFAMQAFWGFTVLWNA